MKAWARLQIVLAREASLVDGAALAALEHDLEEPHACVDQPRPARHVRHREHLAGRDARLHEARGDVDHEAETREPAAALEPSADVAGQRYSLARDAVDGFPRCQRVRRCQRSHVSDGAIVNIVSDGYRRGPGMHDADLVAEMQSDGGRSG